MGRPVCRGLRPVSHEERILVAEGPDDGRFKCLRIQHSTLASTCARRAVEFGPVQLIGLSRRAQDVRSDLWLRMCKVIIVDDILKLLLP